MATQLQREIGNLKKSILTLSALVEDNLRRALAAVERRDEALAAEAIERDFPIDLMEVDVEEDCLKALALYQPVAGDLRFIVTTIKINTTLAMIGAIVAEFFGTPTVGMGFRISTEVGHLSIDMVWATIVVAALTGSAFYALVTLIERRVTFWHASYRMREN